MGKMQRDRGARRKRASSSGCCRNILGPVFGQNVDNAQTIGADGIGFHRMELSRVKRWERGFRAEW